MINIFTIFISAFLGAWFAYRFNLKEKYNEQKRITYQRYFILSENITSMFDNLISYKKGYLDKIKKAYEENNEKESLQITLKPAYLFLQHLVLFKKFYSIFLFKHSDLFFNS